MLVAYSFIRKSIVEMQFQHQDRDGAYKLTNIFPEAMELQVQSAKDNMVGSPVLIKDDENNFFVGVLRIFDKDLCPILFSNVSSGK